MRIWLAVVLLAAAAVARADWTLVSPDNGIHASYADPDTIHRQGAIVRMHGMYSFSRPDFTLDGQRYRSTSVLREYDCAGRQVRLISHTDHSGERATGRVVWAEHRPRPWQPVLDESGDAAFLAIACAPR